MPVEFLSDEQAARYGQYQGDPTPEQLTQYFFLSEADRALVDERRRPEGKLGFALQLCTLRFLSAFLANPLQVPAVVVEHLAEQLQVQPQELLKYGLRGATRFHHRQIISAHLGYREFDNAQAFRLIRWIYSQLALSTLRPSLLFDLATDHLVKQKIVLPGVTVLARLIARIRDRFNKRTIEGLSRRLTATQRAALEELLVLPAGRWQTKLEALRTPPMRVSSLSLYHALHRIEQIRAVGVGNVNLSDVPESRQMVLVRYAQTVRVQLIERLGEDRRLATLLVFLQHLERSATDDVLDMFDGLMSELALKGETRRRRERLRSLKDLDLAALQLRDAAKVLLDEAVPSPQIRDTVFALVSQDALKAAVNTVNELASPDNDPLPEALSGSYTTVRRFLRSFLLTIKFSGTPSTGPLLDALDFIKRMDEVGKGKPKWADAPTGFVTKAWEPRVNPQKGSVDHQAYTLCALSRLHKALKRREVFVERSERYNDPRAELLQGATWEAVKDDVCRALDRTLEARSELEVLRVELDSAYHEVEQHLAQNQALTLTVVDGHTQVHLTTADALDEPDSLLKLRGQVGDLMPSIDLPELLMEVHAFSGMGDGFTHVADGKTRVSDLPLSICAVLLAQACNIGLKAVARPDVEALTLSRLSWVQQNYVRAETITAANARLVDAQFEMPLAQQWGGGEVASADGLRFVVPVRTISAGWNSKYFGKQRGVTYYNFTSDQFTGFHGIVVPGTLRDSLYILAGLLEQQTRLDPREIMADTHGYSDVVFGLFALLGYKFSPRLADLPDQRFWRLDKEADYGALNDLIKIPIN